MSWATVIGLEIHAQLATKSKIFSGASTAYGAEPNTQACLVDLGYPGVLPVLNAEAVRMAVRFGLAIGAKIAPRSVFARKNYFYPDLPKGYQISQYELPVVHDGKLAVGLDDGGTRRVHVLRAHLEEDAGKSLHENLDGLTGIDLNRAGTPLLEIVSAPDLRSAKEAVAYMKKVHELVRHLGICDGTMQEGSFRCDANVSIRPAGSDTLGTRTELKNLNSFRFLERAIQYEIGRQIEVVEGGGRVVQETRLYDADLDETRSMRSKEEANDYRYFPDPDLLPVEIDAAFIEAVRAALPELPGARRERWAKEYGLKDEDAAVLGADPAVADFYEKVARASGHPLPAANMVITQVFALINDTGRKIADVNEAVTADIVRRVEEKIIGRAAGRELLAEFAFSSEAPPMEALIEERGLGQISDAGAIEGIVDRVLADNPGQVEQYRAGKTKVMGFLVGQVMKASGGKAEPAQVNELLRAKLGG